MYCDLLTICTGDTPPQRHADFLNGWSQSINGRFVLGIDVGTTSVKVCLVNVDTGEVSHKFVKDTLATAAKDLPNADLQVQSKFSFN